MHPKGFLFLVAAALAASPIVLAMESSTGSNDRASLGTAMRAVAEERADQLAALAALQLKLDAAVRCAGKGKFYTPDKPGGDEHHCSEITVTHE